MPRLFPETLDFRLGAARTLLDGGDAGVVATGLGTAWALEAAELLEARGIRVSLLHVPTLKPFDDDAVCEFCSAFPVVTTVENHSVVGGLASAVSEALARNGVGVRVRAAGVPDRWADAGSLDYVRRRLGLDAESLAALAEAA